MARIRTIKPDFWRDESLATITPEAALLAIGLLNHADDEGYFNAHPKLIESDIFPLRELSNTITLMIDELHRIGYIQIYKGNDGKQYGHICNFSKHQVINKKNPSKIKDLCKVMDDSVPTTVVLPMGMERKGNGKEKEKEIKVALAPVVLPDWIPLDTWQAFLEMRKKIKKPPTDYAMQLIVEKLDKLRANGQDIKQVLEKSITSSWQDVFEIKGNPYDVGRLTVPSSNEPDPALLKIEEDAKKAAPIPLEVLARMAQIRGRA